MVDQKILKDTRAYEIMLYLCYVKAKPTFFEKLNLSESKSFWKSIKYLSKQSSSIPSLIKDDCSIDNDEGKAQL